MKKEISGGGGAGITGPSNSNKLDATLNSKIVEEENGNPLNN